MNNATEPLKTLLASDGIARFGDIYAPDELATIKTAIDPLLASRAGEKRAYVHPDEIAALGLLPVIFSARMKSVLFSIMPDPVLYHFHIYEIAANNNTSHIFGKRLEGWHRDTDSEYVRGEPTHISIFVYLTGVGEDDGTFEFIPARPTQWLKNGTPYISVQGAAGFSFAWNRPYFHRASPNRGPVRRRLLKISVQRNRFPSAHLGNAHFQTLIKNTAAGNAEMDLLLGRFQGTNTIPPLVSYPVPSFEPLPPNRSLDIKNSSLFSTQTRWALKSLKTKLKDFVRGSKQPVIVAYD